MGLFSATNFLIQNLRPSSSTDRASACMHARATLSDTARKQRLNIFKAELPDVYLLFLFLLTCSCTKCRGLTFMLARVLVSSTCRPSSQPTDIRNHNKCVVRALVPTLARVPTACVSSPKRLGYLHRLAHAARHGFFFSAPDPNV